MPGHPARPPWRSPAPSPSPRSPQLGPWWPRPPFRGPPPPRRILGKLGRHAAGDPCAVACCRRPPAANSSLASPAPNPQVSRLPSLLEPPFGARASPPRHGASSSPAAPRPPHLPTPHVATRCVDGNVPLAPPLTKKTSPRFLLPFPNPSARSSCPKPAHTQPPPSPLSQLPPNSNLTTPHIAPSSSAASAWPWALPRPIAGVDVPWMPMATTVLPAPQAEHCVPEPCQLNEPWPASFVKPGHGSTCTCPWPTWISIRPPRMPGPSKFWHKGSPSTKARSSPSTRP